MSDMVQVQETDTNYVRKTTPEEKALLFGAMSGAGKGSVNGADTMSGAMKTEEKAQNLQADENEVPEPITRKMLIGELLALYPDSAYALMQCGMGCISCGAAQLESIEEASMVHGLDPDEIVDFLNYKLGIIPLDAD